MDLQKQFNKTLNDDQITTTGKRFLLAVSGGVDSVVMLTLFRASGVSFGVAHANFQLRGEASDADELFVSQLAASAGAPFYVKHFDTKAYAQANGMSTQMAARKLRYSWFEDLTVTHGYDVIATAHHLNDHVETALLNFIRGTGLSGMKGMRTWSPPVAGARKTALFRPLLPFSKAQLLAFATAQKVTWREDGSNAETVYARNLLRHQVMPVLDDLNPNFLQTAARNMEHFEEAQENLLFLTQQFLGLPAENNLPDGKEFSLKKAMLQRLPAPRQILQLLLNPLGFTTDQTRQLAENLVETGLELYTPAGDWYVLNDREALVVHRAEAAGVRPTTPMPVSVTLEVRQDDLMIRLGDGRSLFLMPTVAQAPFPDGKESVVVPSNRLVFPLTLRHWQEGDVFQPFGMDGKSQKLQDFFTNQKLSRLEKDAVWLLVNGDGAVIWVVGYRLDERFKASAGANALNLRVV